MAEQSSKHMINVWNEGIWLVQTDITSLVVDAIVNAANCSLLGGGGVDGAIHKAGGPAILEECKKIGGCKTGEAVITTGGCLPAKYVIHTVGPIWQGGGFQEDQMLLSCYMKSLAIAKKKQLHSIAFPSISTGVYGFPQARAVNIVTPALIEYCQFNTQPERIILVTFGEYIHSLYLQSFTAFRKV